VEPRPLTFHKVADVVRLALFATTKVSPAVEKFPGEVPVPSVLVPQLESVAGSVAAGLE
jgi:hypothetical protein